MLCDSMMRDQIVIAVQDKRVRMHLLKETDLILENGIKVKPPKDFCNQNHGDHGDHGSAHSSACQQEGDTKKKRAKAKTREQALERCRKKYTPKLQHLARTAENAVERIPSLNTVSPRKKCNSKKR